MIAVILRWSCDEALEIGTFDLNLPNAERNNGGNRAGENTARQRSEIPLCVGSYLKQRPEGQATENKVADGPEVLRTSIMEQVSRLDALQTNIPCYLPNSLAICQPVQVAPLVRAIS